VKQISMAEALGMDESNYCKLEKGYKPLSLGQLKTIATHLQASYLQILLLAEGDDLINFKYSPLSTILLEYIMMLEKRGEETGFSKEELEFLIAKIKESYLKP
jgi:transcriptional regulator with XRE-family HTH domain